MRDPVRGLFKASDQMGHEEERKGASYKVRALSAYVTVFLLALQGSRKGSDLPG